MSHSHMVIYQTSDGEPGSRQFDEIMAAVAFVEELRNRSGVDVARIFKLEEVKFEFKPYYQVLVVEGDDAASADEVAAPQEAAAPAATEEAAPVAATCNWKTPTSTSRPSWTTWCPSWPKRHPKR